MATSEFAPLIALLLSLAPPDWSAMRVIYRYDSTSAMADTETYALTPPRSKDWIQVSHGGFKMMDFFDAYREKTHKKAEKPWTTVTVTVMRDNLEPLVEFGYEAPNIPAHGTEFGPVAESLLSIAPPDWLEMRAIYRYDSELAIGVIEPYAITPSSSEQWVRISYDRFEMMDFFDAYREKSHAPNEKRWTTVTVTITRENAEPVVEFGYEAPNIFAR